VAMVYSLAILPHPEPAFHPGSMAAPTAAPDTSCRRCMYTLWDISTYRYIDTID
jgi:hypothetical protein